MERLRQLLNYVATRLGVLTLSQRLAIGLCAVLAGFSILWLLQWSSTPELVPLVTHDFTFDQLDSAEASLKGNGIYHQLAGTRIFVRAADRHNALRLLHSADALPEGSLYDMAAVLADQNPFQTPEARDYAQNYAKGNELAKMMATAPFVKQASVIINPRSKRRLGGAADVPTASVAVTLRPREELTEAMVDGLAKLVAGAVAGLKPHNVYITDTRTGRSYNVPHPDDAASVDVLSIEKKREAHLLSKIMSKLADIPGVQVAVSVELETSKRVTQKIKHDQPQAKTEMTQSSEQNSGGAAAESGVQANLGQAITQSGGGQSNSTEQSNVENFEPKLSQSETVEQMPFSAKSVTAAVGIPRSFVAGVFRARFPDKGDPKDDDPDFVKVRDEQVSRVKTSVQRIVMAKNPNDVEIDVYPDMDWSAAGGALRGAPQGAGVVEASAESTDVMALLRTYGPQTGLALLALTSLGLMSRMARRASPIPPTAPSASDAESTAEPILTVGASTVGQAAASETMLFGREVDDETLRYQELGSEVSKLVEADPEGAAQLIRRWMDD